MSLLGLDVQHLTEVRIDAQQCEKPMLFLSFPQRYHFLMAVTQTREMVGRQTKEFGSDRGIRVSLRRMLLRDVARFRGQMTTSNDDSL